MKSLKDMKPGDFHVVGEANAFDWEHKKVARVPFCRVKPGQEIFKDRDYEVTVFSFRYPSEGGVELK